MWTIKILRFYIFIWIFCNIKMSESFRLKFTKVECKLFDKSVVIIENCRLKAVSRYLQYFNVDLHFPVPPIRQLKGDFRFKKKANGYKPFLYNFTFTCSILKYLNPVTSIMWKWFKENTNLNWSCPLTADVHMPRLENIYLEQSLQDLPVPLGEYALFTHWELNNKTAIDANFFGLIF